jgi:hypothetical protein
MTQLLSDNTITPMMSEPRKGTAIVIGGGFGGEIRCGIPQVIFASFTFSQ